MHGDRLRNGVKLILRNGGGGRGGGGPSGGRGGGGGLGGGSGDRDNVGFGPGRTGFGSDRGPGSPAAAAASQGPLAALGFNRFGRAALGLAVPGIGIADTVHDFAQFSGKAIRAGLEALGLNPESAAISFDFDDPPTAPTAPGNSSLTPEQQNRIKRALLGLR